MQNLQCDWLLRVHYDTTMHAVFFVLSPVSWRTNVTKFSVVFTHKSLDNAGNNSVKMKGKNRLKKKKNGQPRTINFKKPFAAVFAEYKFD